MLSAQQETYRDRLFAPGAVDGAPPLTSQQKVQLRLARAIEPHVFVGFLLVAAVQTGENSPGKWGRTWTGFGKRYGTDLAVNAISDAIGGAVDNITHEDPRFFRSQRIGFRPRLRDAVSQVLVAHTDSGGRNLAYGNIIGAYGGTQCAALWLPHEKGSVAQGLLYGTLLLASEAGRNAFREFWPDIRNRIKHK
jgi:hypothetical protein